MHKNSVPYISSTLYPFVSLRELEHLLGWKRKDLKHVANNAGRYYRTFPKTEGSKIRYIDSPSDILKGLQKRILKRILWTAVLPYGMYGARPKGTLQAHASRHTNQPVVLGFDLKNCFPNTHFTSVYNTYCDVFGCSASVANILTKLTTINHHLPQGAPTSTWLCHLTLRHLYQELLLLGKKHGLEVTFWCDDIIVSGQTTKSMKRKVEELICKHSHTPNRRKLRVMKNWKEPQRVTGATVNQVVSVGKEYMNTIKQQIFQLRSTGLSMTDKARLRGHLTHVSHLNPNQGTALIRYAQNHLPALLTPI